MNLPGEHTMATHSKTEPEAKSKKYSGIVQRITAKDKLEGGEIDFSPD
jgi:hypothetical protein